MKKKWVKYALVRWKEWSHPATSPPTRTVLTERRAASVTRITATGAPSFLISNKLSPGEKYFKIKSFVPRKN